jgi:hypothetical protein
MGIGLGVIAGWFGARNPGVGIAIAIIGFVLLVALNVQEAKARQDQLNPASFALGAVGVVAGGLITWFFRRRYLQKRGEL